MTVGRGELKDSSASNSSMKTTVPNKEKETNKTNMNHNNGMNNSKQPSGAGTSPTSTNGGVNGSGNSKDQMSKGSLEKELEEVNKKLGNLSLSKGKKSSAAGGGGDSQHVESEIKLLERKLLLMLKLKNWKDVRDEGYKILGRKGPNPIIYKCVLVSLCRIGTKIEDDILELLDQWNNATPKCSQMQETKSKMKHYLIAIKSGMDASTVLQNVEDVIGLNSITALASNNQSNEPNWRFRPPPKRHNTFSMCSRITSSSGSSCIYGDDCVSAHSKDELKEWQNRAQWNKNQSDGNRATLSPAISSSNALSQTPIPKDRIPQAYQSLPKACMYYLVNLVKRVSETSDMSKLFVDSIPDVRIKLISPLEVRKEFGDVLPIAHKWTFVVASKHPLATVTLFNDLNRDFFAVTRALFINMKRETIDLVDLHPNNSGQKSIQVLNTFIRPDMFLPFNNGWPDWCCYQIEVTFKTMLYIPKVYEQTIVFDFKSDPKIVKKISIAVDEPLKPAPQPVNPPRLLNSSGTPFSYAQVSNNSSTLQKSMSVSDSDDENNSDGEVSANIEVSNINGHAKPSTATSSTLQSMGQKPVALMDLDTAAVVKPPPPSNAVPLMSVTPMESSTKLGSFQSVLQPKVISDSEVILDRPSKANYKPWMSWFLRIEIKLRQDALSSLGSLTEIKLLKPNLPGIKPEDFGLIGEFCFSRDLSKDSKLGRLFRNSCQTLSIRRLTGSSESKPRVCRFLNKSESAMSILIEQSAVNELMLASGSNATCHIWLFLDQIYLTLISSVVIGLKDYQMNILFPELTFEDWNINTIVINPVPHALEDDTILNSKQREAYQAIAASSQELLASNEPGEKLLPIVLTGPSGSGKSFLISQCAIKLAKLQSKTKQRNRILICTFTNEAANEYLNEFFSPSVANLNPNDELLPLRVCVPEQSVHLFPQNIRRYCLFDAAGTNFRNVTLQDVFSRRIIVATIRSCMDLMRLGLPEDTFSHIFIDEASSMLEAESLCPIALAGERTRVIVCGDLMILEPEMFASDTTELLHHPTLVERMDKLYPARHPLRFKLEEVYGNHKDIAQFISDEFYSSSLKSTQTQPSSAQYFPLSFSITGGGEEMQPDWGDGYYNMLEVYEVRDRVLALVKAWPAAWGSAKEHSIAVLTPYADQALALRVNFKLNGLSFVDVETLSNVTSKHYRVVIVSPVRTFKNDNLQSILEVREPFTECGVFTNKRAIYTAFSRAKSLIMVVGDLNGLCNISPQRDIWRQYVSLCKRNNSLIGIQNLVSRSTTNPSPPLIEKPQAPLAYNIPASLPSSISSTPTSFGVTNFRTSDGPTTATSSANNGTVATRGSIVTNPAPSAASTCTPLGYRDRLSTIWDTIPSVNQSNSILNNKINGISDTDSSPWSPRSTETRSFGSLTDPSSIWGSADAFKQDNINSRTASQTNRQDENGCRATAFRSPFDLPDVKLLAEAALSPANKYATNPTSINTTGTSFFSNGSVPSKSTNPPQRLHRTENHIDHSQAGNRAYLGAIGTQNNFSLFNQLGGGVGVPSFASTPIAAPIPLLPQYHSGSSGASTGMNLSSLNQLPRRQSYNLPPRLLNLAKHQASSMASREPSSPDIDFFKEMGPLPLPGNNTKKGTAVGAKYDSNTATSASHLSTMQGLMNNEGCEGIEENFNLDTREFPTLDASGNDDWIEVKSSKKPKSPTTKLAKGDDQQKNKKGKKRSKGSGATIIVSGIISPTHGYNSSNSQSQDDISVEEKIESLKEMGFEKKHAIKALQACDKDLARAVDWLILNAPFKKD